MRGIESNETDFLPPDVAFRVGAQADGDAVRVRWVIADGYYLYRAKMTVAAESPDLVVSGFRLAAVESSRPTPTSAPRRSTLSKSRARCPTGASITAPIRCRSK